MTRICEVTGKKTMTGNNVSHANNKTKRRFLVNLQYKRIWSENEQRYIRVRISNAALRTISKNGADVVLSALIDKKAKKAAKACAKKDDAGSSCQITIHTDDNVIDPTGV